MRPFLLDGSLFGHPFHLASYGVCLALAFSLGYLVAARVGERLAVPRRVLEVSFVTLLVASLLGARLFAASFESFWSGITQFSSAFQYGGLTLFGALLAGLAVLWLCSHFFRVSFGDVADAFAPAALLGIGIGRIGCFLAGCCWGVETSVPWAVTFTDARSFAELQGIPVHPTQLYESALCFLWALSLYARTNGFRARAYRGQFAAEALAGYAILRFAVEFFRGDEVRGAVFGGLFTTSQFLSVVLLTLVTAFVALASRRNTALTE